MPRKFKESDYTVIPPIVNPGLGQPKRVTIDNNKKYGLLTPLERRYHPKYKSHIYWLCKCGKTTIVRDTNLAASLTISCGCKRSPPGKENKDWKGYEEIPGQFYSYLKHNAKVRNHVFEISIQDLWNLYLKQNRKCALSGVCLMMPSSKLIDGNTSLDRIDNLKGYITGNIQWVHKHINIMRGKLDIATFKNYCKLIVNNE